MSLSLSCKHWIPFMALVMLAFVQLACMMPQSLSRGHSPEIVDYCRDGFGRFRFAGSDACHEAVALECPNSALSNYPDACVENFFSPPVPQNVDCSEFRITSPREAFPNANTTQLIAWTPLGGMHYYQVSWGANESLNNVRYSYATQSSESIFLSDNNLEFVGVQTVSVRVEAMVSETVVCSDTVVLTRIITPTATPSPTITPTLPPTSIPFTPTIDCSDFRLTSPLDGLANGVNTIYWDALRDGQGLEIAQGYALTVSDGSTTLASLSTAAGTTNATVDVSSATGGDGGVLTVTVEALVNGRAVCSSAVALPRSAYVPPGGEPPPVGTPGV